MKVGCDLVEMWLIFLASLETLFMGHLTLFLLRIATRKGLKMRQIRNEISDHQNKTCDKKGMKYSVIKLRVAAIKWGLEIKEKQGESI